MKNFDYITNPAKLLTPEIVQMVGCIHEHKGKLHCAIPYYKTSEKHTVCKTPCY